MMNPRLAPLAFLPERVLRHIDVDETSEHLLWMASTTPGGYPRVMRNGSSSCWPDGLPRKCMAGPRPRSIRRGISATTSRSRSVR